MPPCSISAEGATLRAAQRSSKRDIGRVTLDTEAAIGSTAAGRSRPAGSSLPLRAGRATSRALPARKRPLPTGRQHRAGTGPGLSAVVTLAPFGIAWHRDGESRRSCRIVRPRRISCRARPTRCCMSWRVTRPSAITASATRPDPLDRTGRRFTIDAVDPCGFDAELSDPLYKMLPFFIVDGPTGAHGIFYDNLAVGEVDLGCTIDNYHGLFRSYSARGRRPRLLCARRSEHARCDPALFLAHRRPGVRAALVARLCHDIDDDRRCAGCGRADRRISSTIAATTKSPATAFTSARATPRSATRRYVFNWNRDKFPDPAATMARLKRPACSPSPTSSRACSTIIRGSPKRKSQGILVKDGETGEPAVAQFWDGLGFPCRLHQSGRTRLVAKRDRDRTARLRRRLRVERQQRIRDLGRGRDMRRRRPSVCADPGAGGATAPHDKAVLRGASRAFTRASGLMPSRAAARRAYGAMRRHGPATTRQPGRRFAST